LQTVYKGEKAREEGSRVSSSGSCDVYVSTWELFTQMEFLEVTDDVDTSYTSLDGTGHSQPPKKIEKQTRTAEEDAKTELWKSLAASLKPQAAPQQNTVKSELSECANLFGKIVADLLLQYDPKDWSYLKKKVMDVFYDFEQQKSTDRSNYQCAPINPHQFQGNNHFRPGAFFNMLTNASTS